MSARCPECGSPRWGRGQAKQNPRAEGRPPRDFCRVPRRVNFLSPPRINVKILPTTRRHALARAAVTLTADFETVQLGDFLLFRNAHDDVEVVMPEAVRVNYNLGKRIEAEVLAAYEQWAIKQQAGARP